MLHVIAIPVLLIVCFYYRKSSWIKNPQLYLSLIFITIACAFYPKHLDYDVEPFNYPAMPAEDLLQKLYDEHRIPLLSARHTLQNRMIAFSIDKPMSRREVMIALAAQTNTKLKVGYCGTGATILYGAHPSFCSLYDIEQGIGYNDVNTANEQ